MKNVLILLSLLLIAACATPSKDGPDSYRIEDQVIINGTVHYINTFYETRIKTLNYCPYPYAHQIRELHTEIDKVTGMMQITARGITCVKRW